MIIITIKWLFHWEYTLFSDKPMLCKAHLWQVPAKYRGDQQLQNGVHHRSLQYGRLPTVAPYSDPGKL